MKRRGFETLSQLLAAAGAQHHGPEGQHLRPPSILVELRGEVL
jgi:hypothetical protein